MIFKYGWKTDLLSYPVFVERLVNTYKYGWIITGVLKNKKPTSNL